MRAAAFAIAGLAVLLSAPAVRAQQVAAPARGDAARGQALYEQRCVACHSPGADRVGPRHNGVFGRRAGAVAGFDYSPALHKAAVVWDERTLDAWLRDPEALVPGQQMGYSVPEATARADLIAYLRTLSTK